MGKTQSDIGGNRRGREKCPILTTRNIAPAGRSRGAPTMNASLEGECAALQGDPPMWNVSGEELAIVQVLCYMRRG